MKAPKLVNLDDMAHTVAITVGGETFNISRITLEMRQMYGDYLIFSGRYLEKVNSIKTEALGEAPDSTPLIPGRFERIVRQLFPKWKVKKLGKAHGAMTELIESFAIGKAGHIQRLLSNILERNGYPFDMGWWEGHADYDKMEAFIIQAMKKDEEEKQRDPKKAMGS